MSPALNLVSNNLQGYGPSESLSCLGVSGRAVSVSPCSLRELRTIQMSVMSSKCYLRHKFFVCKAKSGSQRRNPDSSRQNRHGFSRNRNWQNEERDSSDNLDETEFLSTKNGPLLSVSNSHKSQSTSAPESREREIVELFRKVQAQLREKAAAKEEKKSETMKEQNIESETVDSLLQLLRKHSVEQGKRKVNGGSTSLFNFDRASRRQSGKSNEERSKGFFGSTNIFREDPKQSGKSNEEKSKGFFGFSNIVREEPQETNRSSYSRPVSNFRRRSPVPRIIYKPVVSSEDSFGSASDLELGEKSSKTHSVPDLEPEAESDIEPDMELSGGLDLDQESDDEEEEIESVVWPDTNPVNGRAAELADAEEYSIDKKESEKQHAEIKDLNAMYLTELKAMAKARGMKGFSKMKKSELVRLLSEDSI